MSDKIKVAIKVRRLIEREESEGLVAQWEVKNNSIFQKDSVGKSKECFSFDHVFDPRTKNYEVFKTVAQPIVDSSVAGFNGTIFAYGQTSSGKTYTMMGSQHEPGIIPLTIQYIFEAVNKVNGREFLLRASYIEIYNEKVNDLLEKGKTGLKLREVEGNVVICGLKEEVVHTPAKIMQLMKRGENIRRIGETNMNERSSRSHTIFRIIIESRMPNEGEDGVVQVSHLNLVDLAGSERVDQTGSKGDRLKEGCCINRSLFMLSHVISQLSEGQDQYVSFRDSKLTRILQSSLGGNAHTAIICAVTPASVEETVSTLGFASRATQIKNKPHVNEVLSDAALLKRYARQIAKLQTELEKTKNRNRIDEVEEIESKLQEQQRRNELLQERIDLLKEKLIGSAATDSAALIKEEHFEGGLAFFETPLEEFELQLMDAEERLSQDSMESPEYPSCNITVRKGKRQHVTFEDQAEFIEHQFKETAEIGSQTDALPIQFHLTNTLQSSFHETPPHILRERIKYCQKEYDELREFTVLEKQIYNSGSYKELTHLEMENRHLQKSVSDLEKMVLDVNCTNSKLHDENKSLKERLEKEFEKCNDLTHCLQLLHDKKTTLSQGSQEIVALKKQLNVATQKIRDLENEKNDFDMVRELAEGKLRRRNEELTRSLEDAWMKLRGFCETESNVLTEDMKNYLLNLKEKDDHIALLKQNIEELTRVSTSTVDLSKIQDELKIVKEENLMYIQELKQKNDCLEQLKQLKENDLNIHLNSMREELNALQESNVWHIEQLREKDRSTKMLTEQIEQLKSEKEENLKYIDKLKNNTYLNQMKQQNEQFPCLSDGSTEQEEKSTVKEENFVYYEQLREKDNCPDILKQDTEDLGSVKECNLRYVEQLQEKEKCLELLKQQIEELQEINLNTQEVIKLKSELKSVTEMNLMYIEQLKVKDACIELIKKESEQLKENDHCTELNSAQEELKLLKEGIFVYVEQLRRNDKCLEILKQQIEDLGSREQANQKYVEELEEKHVILKEEINLLKEDNSIYIEQLKQRNNDIEILKQQIEDLNSVKEANLKCIEQLQHNEICLKMMQDQNEEVKESDSVVTQELSGMQEELKSLTEINLVYIEKLKEKDDYVKTLKKQIEDLNSVNEANLKYIEQLQEKDRCLEQMKEEIEELKEYGLNIQEVRKVQEELKSVAETNVMHVEQQEGKVECLELVRKENDHSMELSTMQGELKLLKEGNLLYIEQLREKDAHHKMLKQHCENLDSAKVTNLKYLGELKEKYITVQEERNFLEEEKCVYIKELKEKDNYHETLKRQIEDLISVKEANLKYIDELKENSISIQEEMNSLKEENSMYIEQLREKDNYLEIIKQQIEALNCQREVNVKCSEQLLERDKCLELLKQQSKELKEIGESSLMLNMVQQELELVTENNLMFTEQLKPKNECLELQKNENGQLKEIVHNRKSCSAQEELKLLKEESLLYVQQLREKDNDIEMLKIQIGDLDSVKLLNLKYVEQLQEKEKCLQLLKHQNKELRERYPNTQDFIRIQEELKCLTEISLVYIEQLKARDECLELLKREYEQLKGNGHNRELSNAQEELKLLKEESMLYVEQLREIVNDVGILNQQMDDLNPMKEVNEELQEDKSLQLFKRQNELKLVTENSLMYNDQPKQKDNCLEVLKQEIEDLGSVKECNLRYVEQLQEKEKCLELLKQQIEELQEINLNTQEVIKLKSELKSVTEMNLMYIEQLKVKDACIELIKKENEQLKENDHCTELNSAQEELKLLKEGIFVYVEQLRRNDKCLEILKQQIEDLGSREQANQKYVEELEEKHVSLKEEINLLKEDNSIYIEQLKQRNNDIEILKQQIEDLNSVKEANLKCIEQLQHNEICLKMMQDQNEKVKENDSVVAQELSGMQEELKSLTEINLVYIEKLKEKDDYVKTLKKQIEDLNSVNEANLKYIEQLQEKDRCLEQMKEEIEELKEYGLNIQEVRKVQEELKSVAETNVMCVEQQEGKVECLELVRKENDHSMELSAVQGELKLLQEENSMYIEQLREKDNYLETIKYEIEDLISAREANLKCIDELKNCNISVQTEMNSLKEENSVCIEQLRRKDDDLEMLKQHIEVLDSLKIDNLRCIDELKERDVSMQEEINSLKEENSMYVEQLKEKDNYLETIKYEIEDLTSAREANLKYIDELKNYNVSVQTEMNSLKEENSVYIEQLRKKDNDLEMLKQHTEVLESVKIDNLKCIDELKEKNICLQEEINSLEEENSVYIEQLRKRDNDLEMLKHHIEGLDSLKIDNLRCIDELKEKNVSMQEEINFLKQENSRCSEQLKEKDDYLETLKQQLKDLDCVKVANLRHIDELKEINVSVQEEIKLLKEKNSVYVTQLREKDNYLETLKENVKDLNSIKEGHLRCIEQLQKDKCLKTLKRENNEKSLEYEVLTTQMDHCNEQLPVELSVMMKDLSDKSYEIESCQKAILKEIRDLKPNYDVESVSHGQLTDLLKILLTFVMEKEVEMFHTLQDRMDEVRIQATEVEKEYADKDRRKDCWVRELEAEVEYLQTYVTKVEEEKKALEMDDKLHHIKILEGEKAELLKKVRQSDSDLAIIQLEMNHTKENMKSHNNEMTKKLKDLQLLVEEKDSLVSQLQEELTGQFSKLQRLEKLMKEVPDLKEHNDVLTEKLENRNSDNDLLLKKVEELKYALLLERNKSQDVMTKLDSLEMELKILSKKNSDLEEEVTASKEVHSLLLKEKEHCYEITLSLKKVTEDFENLMVKKLAWDSEKQQLQAKLAAKQNELSLERNLRCKLEKDMSNIEELRKERDQLRVSYSQMLQAYKMMKSEVDHLHVVKQVHSDSISEVTSQKLETSVPELVENLVLNKQLEEELDKQKELARKGENVDVHITRLGELGNENVNLQKSVTVFVTEKDSINASVCSEDREVEDLKRQLVMCLHEKVDVVAECKNVQDYMQQQENALRSKNELYRHSDAEKGSCPDSLHSESQLPSMRVADRKTREDCETEMSEVKELKERLKVCMEEKLALDDENEQLVTHIRGFENMLERYCVDNDSLEKSKETLETEKERLVSELNISNKRLLDAVSEIQELKLKALAVRKDEASQENSILHCHIKELEAEVENLQSRNKLLLQENESASHNIGKLCALNSQLEARLAERTSVSKSSVATVTDISGPCQCKELAEKVHELKLINVQCNNQIGTLELQIKAEEFPYQQKVKELEDDISFYKSKNMELRTELRRLHHMIKDSSQNCDSCKRRNSLELKHVAVQTYEVKNDEAFLMAGGGGSGIIREDQLMKMRIKIRELETKNTMLKELCRERRQRILELEDKLKTGFRPHSMKEMEGTDSRKIQGIEKESSVAGSSREVGLIQYSKSFSSGHAHGQAGNKENTDEDIQRPTKNMHNNYTCYVRRPLNENVSGIQDLDISQKD